MVALIIWKRC